MLAVRKYVVAIYVDRASQQWVVRDPEGNFWAVPSGQDAWENRQPYQSADDADLVLVPGHYKYLLQLPF